MNAYHFLGQQAYWSINKELSRKVGIHAALLLSDLISKRQWFIESGDIKLGDWFFNTVENIELDTTLSAHEQRKAIATLEENGLIKTKFFGMPRKRYYLVYDDAVFNAIQSLKILTTGREKNEPLVVKNFNGNKNKGIRIKEELKEKEKKESPMKEEKEEKKGEDFSFQEDQINPTRNPEAEPDNKSGSLPKDKTYIDAQGYPCVNGERWVMSQEEFDTTFPENKEWLEREKPEQFALLQKKLGAPEELFKKPKTKAKRY